jgi:SdrD B-like domain
VQSGFQLTATCINGECGHCSINTTMLCNATADCLTGQTCVPMPSNPASISVANGDMDELDFGNVGLSTVSGQKFDYLNPGTGINGFKIVLTGTQANGAAVSKCAITSTNGNYSFGNLLPGSYTVKEMPPAGTTIAKSPTSCAENLQVNGTTCAGQTQTCNFSNICLAQRNVRTIGYWANHGNSSITGAALCALNQLNLRNANGTLFTPITGCPTPSMAQITAGRAAVASFLLSATATNMANMMSAQLAAMELNVMLLSPNGAMLGDELFAGPSSCFTNPPLSALGEITLGDLINWVSTGVIADLGAHGTTTSGSAYRACQEYKKNALDSANNDLNFVGDCNFAQTCP